MTEVTTWHNNDDNVIVQTRVLSELDSLMTLAESTVKSIRHRYGRKAWVSFGVPVLSASVLPLVMSLSPSLSLVMACRFLQGVCHPAMYLSLITICQLFFLLFYIY